MNCGKQQNSAKRDVPLKMEDGNFSLIFCSDFIFNSSLGEIKRQSESRPKAKKL